MREVDPRVRFSRRGFLQSAAAAAPAAALASAAGLQVSEAWAENGAALSPAELKTLVKMARDIYPHDFLGDVYYITAIKPWDGKAAADPSVKTLLTSGVRRLDEDAQARHKVAYAQIGWEADRVAVLEGISHTDFFKKIRSDLVVSLYNQPEIWPKFGYEGSSADKGGYINRGFNDIDWLPKV
ncbi:twin-arginine translocation signal domain-containing protein [Methylobacterium sp. SyP6R]|uniref:twin-arginine translocation signal domain-containing protein n=1 Tax=Methylobacterium sp. SyP6R TaxID=2718876 RepID=UPI001F38203E|nr:twin-arginine translocation signal domain-containing protein [Methylobacterium sp. SyP6R]MCF4129165.1 twin-arginine translocation signal domain-containing protein [Methylobacterium sp. SyP6R]